MPKQSKKLIVRECVSADAVLPPDKTQKAAVTIACQSARVTLDKDADPVGVARVVSERWDRAQAGLAEILAFGATLLEVQAWVEEFNLQQRINSPKAEGPGRPGGTGLKGWLEKNCPGVNYKTAYGYMCAAEGLRREARLADGVPLLAMMGMDAIPEARAERLRQRVQKVIAESTLGLLREAAREPTDPKGGAREGAGRKKMTLADVAAQLGADPELARRRLVPLVGGLRRACLDDDAFGALPDREVEALVVSLSDVCRRGREILEARKNRKAGTK